MLGPKRIKVTEVNPHLICVLCRGYYIDATTIIECLHSFCKTCIVKYLQSNKYCPICDVQVHKTSPLLNIRSDKTLQNIVYKLVPSLFKSEMERRVEFYRQHPEHLPVVPEERGELSESCPIFLPDEVLILCLEYLCDKPPAEMMPKRFIHCPAEMTLSHLIKLIRGKFNLLPTHQVNVLFKDDLLSEHLTVMEVAYTYQCRRRVPIHLYYRILELKKTTIRLLEVKERKEDAVQPEPNQTEETNQTEQKSTAENRPASGDSAVMEKNVAVEKGPSVDKSSQSNEKIENEWKEVQLQISENGVMSVRNMKNSECSPKPAVEAPLTSSQNNSQPVAQLCSTPATQTISTTSMLSSTHVTKPTTSNGPMVSLPSELTTSIIPTNYSAAPRIPSTKPILSVSKVTKDQVKKDFNNVEANKLSISRVPAMGFKEKSEALNKIVSKLSPNERIIGNTSVTIRPVMSTPPNVKTYQPLMPQVAQPVQPPSKVHKPDRKQQQTVKYKTLSSPTKQWNPSIDRTTMLTMKQNYDMSKPPRFFKMRNMPRYLGNPASGVKPMFGTSNEDATKDPKPRSPTKLPPPFTPGSPKGGKSPYPDKTTWTPRVPSPAHSGSLYNANPYLLYSGFPGSFTPDPSILANANPDLMRSMFANSAYHPSLPPSINMLFNPLHNVPRPTLDNPSVQRVQRTKTPPKIDEKLDKPLPNLIPASLPSSHVISRSPTLSPSTLGINPGPSIPPHPSHPPGSLLPHTPSVVSSRLPPPLSISSSIHHHNALLHQNPLHSTILRPLGSPRAPPSPVGSPRTSSPLHTSPPKQLPSLSRTSSPKPKVETLRKSPAKIDSRTEVKSPLLQSIPSSTVLPASSLLPPITTSPPSASPSTTCTVAPTASPSPSIKLSTSQDNVQNNQPRIKQPDEENLLSSQSSKPVSENRAEDAASNNNNIDKDNEPVSNIESVAPPIPNDK